MTPIARHRLRQPGSIAGAVLLAVTAMLPCVAGSSPAADADARFRARLRAALPSSAASPPDQDRLLRMADEVAEEVYADLDRAAAAAREFQALPVATADWRTHEHGGARPQSAPAEMPLWAKPWSAVATAQHAVQWHEATTRPPAAVAVTALLAQLSPPTMARTNSDWRTPILVVEGVEALHVVALRWREVSRRYELLWLERRSLRDGPD